MKHHVMPLVAVVSAVAIGTMALPASAATTVRARWLLDESGTPATAYDSSGNGNDGVNENVVGDGSAYTFNGVNSRVLVPSSLSLNPGTADFSFSVTITTTAPAPGEDYDLLRKGLAASSRGEYKAEVINANGKTRALCLVKDTNKVVASIRGTTDLADGAVHTITCTKTSTGVTLKVDALAPRTKNVGTLGSVSNTDELVIGAKEQSGGDWFKGTMAEARVSTL